MNQKHFALLFMILGVIFAGLTIFFAVQPSTNPTLKYGNIPINANMGYGAIGTGIMASVCFVLSARLVKK